MINKHSIYNWLFFPLLAFLLAGSAASCINDPVMEEDTSGKSTLSITVRGVTTDPADGYDEYIQTLRIIGFDASEKVVCNQLFDHDDQTTDVPNFDIQGEGADAKINITQTLEEAFQGGTCDFYFIANEQDYAVYNTQSDSQLLSDFLGNNVSLDELKKCVIAYDGKEPGVTNQRSILMTTSVTSALKPGDNIKIADVKLIRCVAKVQLIVQKDNTDKYRIPENDVVTISDVSLHGTRPESYSLWDTKSYFAINNSEYQHDFTITDDNKTVGYGTDGSPAYTSDMVYFPEKLYQDNTAEGDLYFTFTLTYTPEVGTAIERTYTVAIGEVADKGGTVDDYNIYRNTVYTVTATLQWQPTEPTMNIQVDAWDEKEMSVDFN